MIKSVQNNGVNFGAGLNYANSLKKMVGPLNESLGKKFLKVVNDFKKVDSFEIAKKGKEQLVVHSVAGNKISKEITCSIHGLKDAIQTLMGRVQL